MLANGYFLPHALTYLVTCQSFDACSIHHLSFDKLFDSTLTQMGNPWLSSTMNTT